MTDSSPTPIQERSRDPVLLTWYRFVRVLRKITYLMDEPMQSLDVSRSQFDLLMQVAFEEGINQQTCAERMNVTKGNIAQHIAHLEKDDLIQRNKEVIDGIMPVHDQRVREILSVLSSEELEQFQSILRKFDRSFT
jgi:DNA-binding MarR family transcriptional regulator